MVRTTMVSTGFTLSCGQHQSLLCRGLGDPVADGDATRGIPAITLAAAGAVATA